MKRVVLPKERRVVAMHLAHDSDLGGNCGVKRTLRKLCPCVTWANANREVTSYVRACSACQRQAKQAKHKAPLHPLPIVGKPFQRITFRSIPQNVKGHKHINTYLLAYVGVASIQHLRTTTMADRLWCK